MAICLGYFIYWSLQSHPVLPFGRIQSLSKRAKLAHLPPPTTVASQHWWFHWCQWALSRWFHTVKAGVITRQLDYCQWSRWFLPSYNLSNATLICFCPKSINIIESPEFWAFCLLLRNSLRDEMIPHHTKMCELIIEAWHHHYHSLKATLNTSVQ